MRRKKWETGRREQGVDYYIHHQLIPQSHFISAVKYSFFFLLKKKKSLTTKVLLKSVS